MTRLFVSKYSCEIYNILQHLMVKLCYNTTKDFLEKRLRPINNSCLKVGIIAAKKQWKQYMSYMQNVLLLD